MVRILVCCLLFLLFTAPTSHAQSQIGVRGIVVDAESGAPMRDVQLFLSDGSGSISDRDGRFSLLTDSTEPDSLTARYVGYEDVRSWVIPRMLPGELVVISMRSLPIEMVGIVISATREGQSSGDVAASIGRIRVGVISDRIPAHPARIMNRIPGVWVNATEGEGHMTAIRQPLSTLAHYLFLENGIPTRSTGFFNHNALFEVNIAQSSAIEIIKGPGTAMHGSDAIGGVINVETGSIPESSGGDVTIEGGSFGFRRMLASGSRVSSQYGLRLDLNITDSDGWRRGTAYKRQSGTLTWRQSTGHSSTLRTVAAFTRVEQHPAGIAAISEEDYLKDGRIHYTPISFRNVTALRLSSSWNRASTSSLWTVTPFFRYSAMDLLPNWALSFDPATWETQNLSFGAQVRYRYDLTPLRTRLIAGVDLDYSPGWRKETEVDPERVNGVFIDYTETSPQYDYDVTYAQASPFFHAEFSPVERLRISAGLRVDLSWYDYENHLTTVQEGSHRRPASGTVSYQQASPKLGVTWKALERVTWFASYRRAFRVPSERQIFRQGQASESFGLKPVIADSYESGIRLADQRWGQAELTVFNMVKANDIVTFNYEDGSRGSVNTGKTRHRGVEMGANTSIKDIVTLAATVTLADHEYVDWTTNLGNNYSGNGMEVAPRTVVNAEMIFHLPLFDGIDIGADVSSIGGYWMDAANTSRYGGHQVLNIRLNAFITPEINLVARVGNATDVLYAERATTHPFRGDEFAPGAPRNMNVALRYAF
ncbi:MAG: TonB-dependent receptor [Bacteroidetes bacterium]|nr:TonB-dependent receptor [Bacteroidota bacterium]